MLKVNNINIRKRYWSQSGVFNINFGQYSNTVQAHFLLTLNDSLSAWLTLQVPTPKSRQTHAYNSSAFAEELFECV